jgi:hypothetical protein
VLRSRKGDAIIIGYNKFKIYDPPRQLDLPAASPVISGWRNTVGAEYSQSGGHLPAEVGVKYTNTRSAMGSVDHEKGIAARRQRPRPCRRRESRASGAGSTMVCRCR